MINQPPPAKVAAQVFTALHEFYAANPESSPQLDHLLSWIYQQNADGTPVRSTDLVREVRFGTLPTVTDHLNRLTLKGLIDSVVGYDRRMKMLKVTKAGEAVLAQRAKLMAAAVAIA